MNCKDFKTKVEEGLKGDSLSIAAQDHAAACRPCREFNQKHVEFREWLMVCEKINAPKDFGFGVQRKIASSSAVHTHDWLWQGLRYIVPSAAAIAVLVLVIGYLSTNNAIPENKGVAAISNSEIGNPAAKDNIGAPNDVASQTPQPESVTESAKPENEKLAVGNTNTNRQDNKARVPSGGGTLDSKGGGGSLAQGVNDSKPAQLPEGIHLPSSTLLNQSNIQTALLHLGVITATEKGVVKVTFVKPNASRAGVIVGDVIESLSRNVLTVKRGGQTLTINFNNKR